MKTEIGKESYEKTMDTLKSSNQSIELAKLILKAFKSHKRMNFLYYLTSLVGTLIGILGKYLNTGNI